MSDNTAPAPRQIVERRPEITLALDVRSTETVVVMADPGSAYQYPDDWVRPLDLAEAEAVINPQAVLVIDRIGMDRETIKFLISLAPRITAFVLRPKDLDFEKEARRSLRALYPFAEVWDVLTDMGKCLVTATWGHPYDRDRVIDQRPTEKV